MEKKGKEENTKKVKKTKGDKKIPYTTRFTKLLKATQKEYGKKAGKGIAFAIAKKKKWKT